MSHTEAAGSDERWARALDMARGTVDEQHMRRTRLTMLRWIAVGGVVCAVVGLAVGFYLVPGTGIRPTTGTEWTRSQVTGFILSVAGVVMVAAGFIWAKRTGRLIPRWRSVISPLNFREQKLAQKQVAGKSAVDTDKLTVLIALARQNKRVSFGTFPLLNGAALSGIGAALLLDHAVIWILELVVVTSILGLVAISIVATRRADRFLAQYEETSQRP